MNSTIIIHNEIPALSRLTKQGLRDLGYLKILEPSNIKEVDEIIFTAEKDLVLILELRPIMVHKNELGLMKKLRQYKLFKNIFVIVTSEVIDKKVYDEFRGFGVNQFLQHTFYSTEYTEKLDEKIRSGPGAPRKCSEPESLVTA
jgi:hypothetical protein